MFGGLGIFRVFFFFFFRLKAELGPSRSVVPERKMPGLITDYILRQLHDRRQGIVNPFETKDQREKLTIAASTAESFYVSRPPPPQLSLNETGGFGTGSRPYLLETRRLLLATRHSDVIVRRSFVSKKNVFTYIMFTASFLVSSSHEMFVKEDHRVIFGRGGAMNGRIRPLLPETGDD